VIGVKQESSALIKDVTDIILGKQMTSLVLFKLAKTRLNHVFSFLHFVF
jgi:hypothetical protein